MDDFYSDAQRRLQSRFGSTDLADLERKTIVHAELDEHERAFIESRDMFFLATVDARGQPTCSYKGGDPGFVRAVDSKTLVFPLYDGNGMYLSAGNIQAGGGVGLLFIDFDTPNRLRVQGRARLADPSPELPNFCGAELVVCVDVDAIFVNCPRYIHRRPLAERSRYVPRPDRETPLAQWKRIDLVHGALKPADVAAVAQGGGTITMDEYLAKLSKGEA